MTLRRILAAALLLPGLALLRAQQHGSIAGVPFSTPDDVRTGGLTFRTACASCHGGEGVGSAAGPALNTGAFKRGSSDEALFGNITKGVAGTPMVGFALEGRDVWQLIAYIRSLSVGRGAENAKGNATHGAQLFRSNGCVKCHTAGGAGGYLGPDLGEIGSQRTLAQLERSIVDPNAEVSPDFWRLRLRTRSGQEVTGIRLNEDMDTFQLREGSGRLRTFRKADLASHETIQTSPMGSFRGKLSRTDLDDLLAFLASLRTPAAPQESAK